MKKRALLVATIVTLLFTVYWTAANTSTTKGDHERASLKVLKVFDSHDGDHLFRAYLVKWKDQEVIAEDTLVRTNYHEGDMAPILVMRSRHPDEKVTTGLLRFSVVPF